MNKKKEKLKGIYEYKLGETINRPLMNGLLQPPIKLVRIGYTYQDKNGTQMESALSTNDYIEDDEK